MKTEVFTDRAPKPVGPYSQAVRVGNFLFLSGQIGIEPSTGRLKEDFQEQAKQVFENIGAILEQAGYSWEDVVRVVVYLRDLSKFKELNDIYEKIFKEVKVKPARSTVEVSNLPLGAMIEVEITAYKEG